MAREIRAVDVASFFSTKILLQLLKMGTLTSHVVRSKKHDCRGHACFFALPKKHDTICTCAQNSISTVGCLVLDSLPLFHTT